MQASGGKRKNCRQSERDHIPTHAHPPDDNPAEQGLHARFPTGHRGHDDRGQGGAEKTRDAKQRREPQEWIDPGRRRQSADAFHQRPTIFQSSGLRRLRRDGFSNSLTSRQQRNAHRPPEQRQQQILGGTEDRVSLVTERESND
jgi:hypothetical protein